MKAQRIAIRPLRQLAPALPADVGDETVLLLRVDNTGRVVERQLFHNHKVGGRTCVHGFTHWARLPFYLPSPNVEMSRRAGT